MRIRLGKKVQQITADELAAAVAGYEEVLIDIGTGDGLFVYRWANAHPEVFCIGIDAAGENMREASARALKKPARGGVRNAMFVIASVENLPPELSGIADTVTVNFPWGSLLKALVECDADILKAIARLARPGARFVALLNYSVFKDQDYADRIGLPPLTAETIDAVLRPAYEAASISIVSHSFLQKEVPHRTSWGQHLILGSARQTLMIEGLINTPPGQEAAAPVGQ